MLVIINNETKNTLDALHENLIKDVIKASLETEAYNNMAEVSVTIVINEKIKEINKEFRNIDKVTDVLSFPIINFEMGELPPQNGNYLLGDIVFSFDKALEQAEDYGHSVNREIGFFIAHSMLHLMGYDHKNKEEETIMFKKQEDILNKVGLIR